MAKLWERTLLRLSQLFLQKADQYQVSTLVVYANNKKEGREVLRGPHKGNMLRNCTGIDRPALPPSFMRMQGLWKPLRAIYFGGDKAGAKVFAKLINDAGNMLEEGPVQKLLPPDF